jgi:hypothetical protein
MAEKRITRRGFGCAALGLCLSLLLLPLPLGGCADNADGPSDKDATYTIRVTGSDGQAFNGFYSVMEADGHVVNTDVEGIAPKDYRVKGLQVDLTFNKPTRMGYLEVTILRGSTQVAYGDIPASFGSLSLTGR